MLSSTATPVRPNNISPAKRIRSIRRLLSFQFKKMTKSRIFPSLSICHQEQSSFPPSRPNLTYSRLAHTSTKPPTRQLSFSLVNTVSIEPKKMNHETMAMSIPQLDGSSDMFTSNVFQNHQPPGQIQCITCKRFFETRDDFRWHEETQYGREDCLIVKSMLSS